MRHLSHETKHKTEFTRMRRDLYTFFKILNDEIIRGKIVFYSTEKHKMQKNCILK